jgi:16S rRNA (guanine1207-N2)-methyltransferase
MTEHYYSAHPESTPKIGLIKASLCGRQFEFLTASSVFSKKRVDSGTRLLIESMLLPDRGAALDIGCGYGAVGIVAAVQKPALHVLMTDVNMRAVHFARENIGRNRVANAEVRFGCLYEPVEGSEFDVVLSNPPVSAGMETVNAIITQAPKIMAPKATLQMVVRSKIGGKALPALFEAVFGNCRVLARQSGYRVLIAEKL